MCPAVYDLGQAFNVVALAVTEGEDKPLKYPVMFRKADLVLVTKTDLLPYLDVRLDAIDEALARVTPRPLVFHVSARSGDGMDHWFAWLESRLRRAGARSPATPRTSPPHLSPRWPALDAVLPESRQLDRHLACMAAK